MAYVQTPVPVAKKDKSNRTSARRGMPGTSSLRPWTHFASTAPHTSGPRANALVANVNPSISNPVPVDVHRASCSHRPPSEPDLFELPEYPRRIAPPPYVSGTWGGLGTADPNNADESHDHLPPYRSTETLQLPAYAQSVGVARSPPSALSNARHGGVRRWYGVQADPQRMEEGNANLGQGHSRYDIDIARPVPKRKDRSCLVLSMVIVVLGLAILVAMSVMRSIYSDTLEKAGK